MLWVEHRYGDARSPFHTHPRSPTPSYSQTLAPQHSQINHERQIKPFTQAWLRQIGREFGNWAIAPGTTRTPATSG
ncbi:MAG: hypothetical protein AAFY26_06530 [Cyanobacteria bacterium J06638_22]